MPAIRRDDPNSVLTSSKRGCGRLEDGISATPGRVRYGARRPKLQRSPSGANMNRRRREPTELGSAQARTPQGALHLRRLPRLARTELQPEAGVRAGGPALTLDLRGPGVFNAFGEFAGDVEQHYIVAVEFEAAPVIDSVAPATGSAGGRETVVVHGRGFGADMTVLFDGVAAEDVTLLDGNRLRCLTPPGAPGFGTCRSSVPTTAGSTAPGGRPTARRACCATASPTPCPPRPRNALHHCLRPHRPRVRRRSRHGGGAAQLHRDRPR